MFQTNWRAGMQDVSAAIDDTMGEIVTITPTNGKPNYQSVPDEARRAQAVATFSWKSKSIFSEQSGGRGMAGSATSAPLMEIESREPTFSFTHSKLPFPLLRGYWIERYCDGSVFEVTSIRPDGVARVVAHVNQLGRPHANG